MLERLYSNQDLFNFYREMFEYLDAPIQRVAALDVPIPFNYPEERAAIVNEAEVIEAEVIEAVRKIL